MHHAMCYLEPIAPRNPPADMVGMPSERRTVNRELMRYPHLSNKSIELLTFPILNWAMPSEMSACTLLATAGDEGSTLNPIVASIRSRFDSGGKLQLMWFPHDKPRAWSRAGRLLPGVTDL